MKELIDYLLQFVQFNQQQIELVTRKVKEIHLKIDDVFSEAGKIAGQIEYE